MRGSNGNEYTHVPHTSTHAAICNLLAQQSSRNPVYPFSSLTWAFCSTNSLPPLSCGEPHLLSESSISPGLVLARLHAVVAV
jgi:hypothetical protein